MAFWFDKQVLITGCKGFMAGWLEHKLLDLGAITQGFDKPPVDIRDYERMSRLCEKNDIIFHLAAISGVEASKDMAMEAIDINVRGTYTILEAARNATKPPVVLVATSNHVYGPQTHRPTLETASLNQLDTYSASKVCADVLTRAYYHNYELPTAAVRNTNCFGPGDPHNDHIIPGTILSILRGEQPVIRGRGGTCKSYMHVEDTVEAYMLIAELAAEHPGEAWNVSSGRYSVIELVNIIRKVMGWEGGVVVMGREDDQSDEWLDTSKIQGFGWKPKWDIHEAIKDTVEWIKSHECSSSYSR